MLERQIKAKEIEETKLQLEYRTGGKKNEIKPHFHFPKVLKPIILDYLDGDIGETATYFNNRKEFTLFAKNELPLIALLNHVVRGEQNQAELMVKKNPNLLLDKGQVKDYSGRTIQGTALQIALAAEDFCIRKDGKDEECMAEMIKRYLKMRPDGESEILKQQNEQFPADWEKNEEKRNTADLEMLNKVFKAIDDSKQLDAINLAKDCQTVLDEFREYLKPKKVITTGLYFNINLLIEAFILFDINYNHFDGDNSNKNNLVWQQVIGYIERFLPARLAQDLCGSFHDFEFNQKLNRRLIFSDRTPYFPLDSNPHFRLGYDFAVRFGLGGAVRGSHAFRCAPEGMKYMVKLSQLKKDVLRKHIQNQEKSMCLVM